MIKKFTSSLKEIGFLTIALTLALCANFAFGAWSNPPANPPSSNTDAPINVGSSAQAKTGNMGVRELSVISGWPEINLVDTTNGEKDTRIIGAASRLYIQANGGTTGSPSWDNQLVLYSAQSSTGKYAKVFGTLRADEYCDGNGNNCFSGSPAAPVETDPQVGTLNAGQWCRSNNAGSAIYCGEDAPVRNESDPQVGTIQVGKMCVGNAIGSAVTCSQNVPEPSLGSGQHWYDVTGSRSRGTTYTNNTGQSISVNLSGDGEWLNGNFQVRRPGGSWVTIVTLISNDGNWRNTTGIIIPDGYSYRLNGGYDVKIWAELR